MLKTNQTNPKGENVKYSDTTYVMTSNPYTQPIIFNIIQATKYRGIMYAVVSSIAFALINVEWYLVLIPAELLLVCGFLYLKYVLLKQVVNGKFEKTAVSYPSAVSTASFCLSTMRSAFIRPIIMMAFILYEGYSLDEVTFLVGEGFTSCIFGYIIGTLVFVIAYFNFLKPARDSLKDWHLKVLRFLESKQTVDIVDNTAKVDPVKPKVAKFYGVSNIITNPPTPKAEKKAPQKNSQAPASTSANQTTTPKTSDIFENKRVTRKRRDF